MLIQDGHLNPSSQISFLVRFEIKAMIHSMYVSGLRCTPVVSISVIRVVHSG